jgi:hypothetical protein
VRQIHAGRRLSWLIFAPLALTLANLAVMRNYFGHHPWMAGPVLAVGVIFSLAILRNSAMSEASGVSEGMPLKAAYAVVLVSFIYGFAVLTFFRANETELLMLIKLVRQHTARSDTILILKTDSDTAMLADRFDEPLDRHVIVVDNPNVPANGSRRVILSSVKFSDSLPLLAASESDSRSWLTHITDWFNRSISHRRPGDRLELANAYYLYEAGR